MWSATGVSYILTNERYMGDELFQKRFTTDAFPFKKVKNRARKANFMLKVPMKPLSALMCFDWRRNF